MFAHLHTDKYNTVYVEKGVGHSQGMVSVIGTSGLIEVRVSSVPRGCAVSVV